MTGRRKRFGPRVFGMLLCAYIWLLIGVGGFLNVSDPAEGVVHLLLTPDLRGTIWTVAAAGAVVTAWSRRASSVGLAVLALPPLLTGVSFLAGWFIYLWPGGMPGAENGWYSAALYAALVGLVILTALIPSPPVRQVVTAA